VPTAGCSFDHLGSRSCSKDYCAEVVLDSGGGAANSAYLKVYVSDRSGGGRKLVLDGNNIDGLALSWIDTRTLQINYANGTIVSFTNEWRVKSSATVEPAVSLLLNRTNVR